MTISTVPTLSSFAQREVVAPVGLWERGAGASGYILPPARLFPNPEIQPRHLWRGWPVRSAATTLNLVPNSAFCFSYAKTYRAPKAFATSPSGETPTPCSLVICGDARSPGLSVENLPETTWSIVDRANGQFYSPDAHPGNLPLRQPANGELAP